MKRLMIVLAICLLDHSNQAQLRVGTLSNGSMITGKFEPSWAPNLMFWSRPESVSGADNTAVTTWNDDSGNGAHFKEKVVGGDPVITNNVINGKLALWFNGTTAQLTNAFRGGSNAQPITVFMVCAIGTSTNNSKIYDGVDLNGRIACSSSTNGNLFSLFAGTTDNSGNATVVDKWYQWTHIFNGASSIIRSNGIVYLSPTTSGSQGALGLTLMMRPDTTRPCKGYMAEILAYHADLTATATLTNVEIYLKNKYGL